VFTLRGGNRYLTAGAFAALVFNERVYAYARYSIRDRKGVCLQEDVGDFMAKHESGLSTLADKLLDNQFERNRYCDPTYPI